MTMRLAKSIASSLAVLAAGLCLAASLSAQEAASKPAAQAKPKAHSKATAKSDATKNAAAPANAEATPGPSASAANAPVVRRDPFLPLVSEHKEGTGEHLPPGKAGLVVSTVRVDGAVSAPSGMLAVVSNPDQRVYFIREGDRLYDGTVEKIGLDGVTFRETSKDAFGKPIERLVTKRIYASAGEQQ
jgi:hypothetical protein